LFDSVTRYGHVYVVSRRNSLTGTPIEVVEKEGMRAHLERGGCKEMKNPSTVLCPQCREFKRLFSNRSEEPGYFIKVGFMPDGRSGSLSYHHYRNIYGFPSLENALARTGALGTLLQKAGFEHWGARVWFPDGKSTVIGNEKKAYLI